MKKQESKNETNELKHAKEELKELNEALDLFISMAKKMKEADSIWEGVKEPGMQASA